MRLVDLFLLSNFLLVRDNGVAAFSSPQLQQQQQQQQLHSRQPTGHRLWASTLASPVTTPQSRTKSLKNRPKPWHDEFEVLRSGSLHRDELEPFFAQRPHWIAKRLTKVTSTLYQAKQHWERTQNATQLCQAVSSLGPLAVKVGQTLSQRPDLVGVEAAAALKTLQTKNLPFGNPEAYAALHQSLDYWEGPLAANLVSDTDYYNDQHVELKEGPPLYEYLSPDPVCAASLGQVYKARLYNGTEVAIKVQRPDAQAILAMDAHCFRLVWAWKQQLEGAAQSVESVWKALTQVNAAAGASSSKGADAGQTEQQVRAELGGNSTSTVGGVIDRVAMDIHKELDYRIEAANGQKFRDSLDFLGFVTTPNVLQVTNQVLVTEWVQGKHLEHLNTKDGLALTQMAVQACTASMVLTGFVHADPHEGNVMLHDDGRIVFLDFGLMSSVAPEYMEGFARGIQALLSSNWQALVEAFVDTEFVAYPIRHRDGLQDLWRQDPHYGLPELAKDLEVAMKTTKGGQSRFGALATVLNKKISPYWLVFTPPYVILLIRTFLTLEGMAAAVDPDFNIYEMAMPSAIKRSLSPCTQKGVDVFRSALLTQENKIQWQRLVELANSGEDEGEEVVQEGETDEMVEETTVVESTSQSDQSTQAAREKAKKAAMNDAISSLLGSSDGRALRRVIKDLDSVDLLAKLAAPDNRFILEKASTALLNGKSSKAKQPQQQTKDSEPKEVARSPEFDRLQRKQRKWRKQVLRVLVLGHVRRCLLQWRGFKNSVRLLAVSTKVFVSTWWQKRRQEQNNNSGMLAFATGLFFLGTKNSLSGMLALAAGLLLLVKS